MNNIENLTETLSKAGLFTEKEIWGQPDLWKKVYEQVLIEKETILAFLETAIATENIDVVLTGAGSSAFVGLSLTGTLLRHLKKNVRAVSTTDLVTHPLDYLNADMPVLLISFARSGNSPESVAAVSLADSICKKVFHLIITCDAEGALANYDTTSLKYNFILPAEANDKSLAMTGSYSGMLLAGLLIARIKEIESLRQQVNVLRRYALTLLSEAETFRQLASFDFERMVFLGSGVLFGTATESHLKVQELTDGKVICKNDSFLGFRHGPKAVIDEKTIVFMLFSNQAYVQAYEADLAGSIADGQKPLFTIGLTESATEDIKLDKLLVLSGDGNLLEEEFLPVCFILPAQMIGYYKSLQLGHNPDQPSESGAISRVVEGVHIYPFHKEGNSK